MANKAKKIVNADVKPAETVKKYKGSQLLKDDRYNNRVGRIVIDSEKYYSCAEADEMISDFLNTKG